MPLSTPWQSTRITDMVGSLPVKVRRTGLQPRRLLRCHSTLHPSSGRTRWLASSYAIESQELAARRRDVILGCSGVRDRRRAQMILHEADLAEDLADAQVGLLACPQAYLA
jgi:hypothetical protein